MIRAGRMAMGLGLACALAGGDAAAQPVYWSTVPMAAAHNETGQVQALLLKGGADPDAIDSTSGRTALDWAASFDNVTMAQVLLAQGAHVDARDPNGNTALYWAAERGTLAMMRFLIAHKAAADAANRVGVTPLMAAADHTQPEAVRLLLASGADPTKQDFTGRDAVGWAAGKPTVLQVFAAKR